MPLLEIVFVSTGVQVASAWVRLVAISTRYCTPTGPLLPLSVSFPAFRGKMPSFGAGEATM